MSKEQILEDIRHLAIKNDGVPLGIVRFEKATGIRRTDWEGVFLTKWSDALLEAGFQPNDYSTPALDEEQMIIQIIEHIRELGHFPTLPEFRIKKRTDSSYPSVTTINKRVGNKHKRIEKILKYCEANDDYDDIVKLCLPLRTSPSNKKEENEAHTYTQDITGHVYLLKHDKVYKIGKSIDVTRRYKEIRTQMPYETEEVHVIETDDPSGIEAYWHKRFKDKRVKGEWFELTMHDVKIFKKRKFM